jgi:2-C-methyl-D-erythritol 4-phosphate cytidylyltransferase
MPQLIALVPAAGAGRRFQGDEPKLWAGVVERPVLTWTLERLLAAAVDRIVVAVPGDRVDAARSAFGPLSASLRFVSGGNTRQESVALALAADSGDDDDLILVHDGARPAVSTEDIRRTVEAADLSGAAILGRPETDTLKRVRGEAVVETVPRGDLFRAETPQVFRRTLLQRAHEQAASDGFQGTDESSLVERMPGSRVRIVMATGPNPKLTRVADLEVLEFLLRQAPAATEVETAE